MAFFSATMFTVATDRTVLEERRQQRNKTMKETMKIKDPDLALLAKCTDGELDPMIEVLQGKDRRGRISSELEYEPRYKLYYPQHSMYADLIADEFQKYGGNTICNIFRGEGVPYKEMLCDVCDKMKVNYNPKSSVERIEECLLAKVLEEIWEKMSDDEKRETLEAAGCNPHAMGGMTTSMMIALFRQGGFASYKIVLKVLNVFWRWIFGKGLPLVANKTICKTLAFVTGPVGWGVSAVWTAIDISSPALRVTIPGVIYIAALRRMKNEEAALAAQKAA